ncbi:hypothetical protein RP20_CCG013455 [Aedes albopictus]|nr:uncharacterized protein LOC109622400 [Aedes albopictus]KXJ82508.1 hypothetical protein RP20_CCG013455 [Aedes albopictus]
MATSNSSKGTKIKYAKLRLFKPSSSSSSSSSLASGGRSQPLQEHEGTHPKTPSSESIERMEQEIINLSDSEERNPAELVGEPIIKRTRLDEVDKPVEKSKLPKFPKKPPEDGTEGVISKFFKTSEDDFEPPKPEAPAKAKTRTQRKATVPRKPRAPRKPKNQADIRKVFQKYKDNDEGLLKNLMLEHTLADRLDPDEFQLAVAMSRSLVDQSGGGSQVEMNAEEVAEASSSCGSLSSEERRTTLEHYGFKCKTSYYDSDLNVIFGSAPKNAKRSKHKKPSMLIRRDFEDIVGFMGRQARRLFPGDLDRQFPEFSESDLGLRTYGSTVFFTSQHPGSSWQDRSDYYVELLVDMSEVKADYLLKNWSRIPGREPTPERRLSDKVPCEDEEPLLSPAKPEGKELLEDPEDSLLDMNTVPEEYRHNEVPVHVRVRKTPECKTTKTADDNEQRSASPDLFGSDSDARDDPMEVEETPRTESQKEAEDDKFLTAQQENEVAPGDVEPVESLEGVVRATSSENIFEDSDPIIDYEMYSSEEAKMRTSFSVQHDLSEHHLPEQQPIPDMNRDSPKDVIVVLSSTDDSNSNQLPAQAGPRVEAAVAVTFPSLGKDFSFHALAMRQRLSEVSGNGGEIIEVVDDDGTSEEEREDLSQESSKSVEKEADVGIHQAAKRTTSDNFVDCGIREKEQRFDRSVFLSPGKEFSFRALSITNQGNTGGNEDMEVVEAVDDGSNEVEDDNSKFADSEHKEHTSDNETKKDSNVTEQHVDDIVISSSGSTVASSENQILEGYEIGEDNTRERVNESSASSTCEDDPADVLVISDDEVNYSIRQDFSILYNVSPLSPTATHPREASNFASSPSRPLNGDDLNGTKVYFDVDDYKRLSSGVGNSDEHKNESPIVSTDVDAEPNPVANETNRADNTLAFLDGIIKKFNLPTTLTKQSTHDESKPPDLDDYMNNYEISDFSDDNHDDIGDDVQTIPVETPAPIPSEQLDLEIEHVLSQARITCTQLEQQRQLPRASPIRRTTSDSVLLGSKTSKQPPTVQRKAGFDEKFEDLAKDAPSSQPVEIEIELDSVSPRPDYDGMESPLLHRELFKFGMKQLKRSKAVQFLNFIYDQTHPMVEIFDVDECDCGGDEDENEDVGVGDVDDLRPPRRGDVSGPSEIDGEDYILPSKPRKKTFWCAVPLHIAFHNMINEKPEIRRQMLRYEPIDLDAIFSHLKEMGLRYESNDLIAFLDKRCITFRTVQGSGSRTKKTTANQSQAAGKTAGS